MPTSTSLTTQNAPRCIMRSCPRSLGFQNALRCYLLLTAAGQGQGVQCGCFPPWQLQQRPRRETARALLGANPHVQILAAGVGRFLVLRKSQCRQLVGARPWLDWKQASRPAQLAQHPQVPPRRCLGRLHKHRHLQRQRILRLPNKHQHQVWLKRPLLYQRQLWLKQTLSHARPR